MKYAIVDKDNVVENIVEYDGKTAYKPKGTLVKIKKDQIVDIGWLHKDGEFTEPKKKTKSA